MGKIVACNFAYFVYQVKTSSYTSESLGWSLMSAVNVAV